ncbi:MAG: tripartite tricarboxylate transporter substrate binding protein [Alphaproteobacteria bacterium]|nr:tripartite tricarboxylate transporter substrate binding protein [Alphaproteobacteria bacterium]
MMHRRSLAALAALPFTARAQSFPDRPMRMVLAYGAGGPSDTVARLMARHMSADLGQTMVVDNRPGAGGQLATEQVTRAAGDGHTLLMVDNGMVIYAPALFARLPFDPDTDLSGIGMIARFPLMLIVRADSPWRDFAGFVAAARTRPPTFGSGGVASPHHLGMELLRRAAGFEATHVPYRNSPAAIQDMMAGAVDAMLADSATATLAMRNSQARALMVMAESRVSLAPDAPTTRELGLPDALADAWMALSTHAGTPTPAVARLNTALGRALAQDEVQTVLRNTNAQPAPGDAAAFNAVVRAESARWRPLIRELGIRLEG